MCGGRQSGVGRIQEPPKGHTAGRGRMGDARRKQHPEPRKAPMPRPWLANAPPSSPGGTPPAHPTPCPLWLSLLSAPWTHPLRPRQGIWPRAWCPWKRTQKAPHQLDLVPGAHGGIEGDGRSRHLWRGSCWVAGSFPLITFLSERSRGLRGSWGQGGRGLALTSGVHLHKAMGLAGKAQSQEWTWHSHQQQPQPTHCPRMTLLMPAVMSR